MTDEEFMFHYENMKKLFKDVPDPEHFPKTFAYFVKLYKYYYGKQYGL